MKTNTNDDVTPNAAPISTKLQHETLAIEAVKLPKHIPKILADRAVQDLMRAISRSGQQIVPVLVDDQNEIIAGFEVFIAMRELGAKDIGVVRLSNLTKAQAKAIMLLPVATPLAQTTKAE